MRLSLRGVALAACFLAMVSEAAALTIVVNDKQSFPDCPSPQPIDTVCKYSFNATQPGLWNVFGTVVAHNYGGVAGDLILTDFQFEALQPVPPEGGPGLTLEVFLKDKYVLAPPFPGWFSSSESLDGRFSNALAIASLSAAGVVVGGGGPARGSSASLTTQVEAIELPPVSAVKTSPAGDSETFSGAQGPFFGIPNVPPIPEALLQETYFFRLAPGTPADTAIVMDSSGVGTWEAMPSDAPEPSTLALLLFGGALLTVMWRRRAFESLFTARSTYPPPASPCCCRPPGRGPRPK